MQYSLDRWLRPPLQLHQDESVLYIHTMSYGYSFKAGRAHTNTYVTIDTTSNVGLVGQPRGQPWPWTARKHHIGESSGPMRFLIGIGVYWGTTDFGPCSLDEIPSRAFCAIKVMIK